MGSLNRVGIILFILYHPIFLLLLFLAVKKYKGYSFTCLWMSNLGDSRFRSSVLFNSAFLLYGIVNLFFVYGLSQILPGMLISTVGLIFLYLSCLATIIGSQIPIDKNLKTHHKFTNLVFMGMALSSALLSYPVLVSSVIPPYFLVFNVLLVTLAIILGVSFVKLVKKTGEIPVTLFDIRKVEKSLLIRNAAVQEWLFFLVVLVWNFASSLVILRYL